jgi:hypothetical protein
MMMTWLSFAVALMSLVVAVEFVFNKPKNEDRN